MIVTVIKTVDSDKQNSVDSFILEKRGKITFFIFYFIILFVKIKEYIVYSLLGRNPHFLDE